MNAYRNATRALAATTLLLGVAMLAVTAARGGGQLGFVVGALFVAAGAGRLYLLRK